MAPRLKSSLILSSLLLPNYAYSSAIEAFQTGPLGSGYGFSVINGLQSEVKLQTTNEFGKETYDAIPNEKLSSNTYRTNFSSATGFRASPEFYIIGYADVNVVVHSQESRLDKSEFTSGANTYEFGVKAVYENGPYTIGGRLGLHNIGGEIRTLKTAGVNYETEASWSTIPQLEVMGGYKWLSSLNIIRFKLYSQGEFEAETKNSGKTMVFDSKRKIPAELALSSLIDINHQLQLGAEIKVTASSQASQSENQWSTEFSENGSRNISGDKQDTNQISISAGGKFFPTPIFSISAATTYETSKYSAEDTASLEYGNYGGLSFDFGTEFIPTPKARISANTSYTIPKHVEYVKSASEESVLAHQKITTGSGSNAKSSLAKFSLSLGGTYMF